MIRHHAMHLTADRNTVDGDTRANPPGVFDLPVPSLIMQLVRMVGGDGTILIHPSAAAKLALPVEQLPAGKDAREHPVAVVLRAHGWKIKDVHRWFHVKHPEYGQAHIGLTGFFDSGHFPLIATPAATTAALAHWHRLTGHAWTGSAGDAGNQIFRSITYQPRRGGQPVRPEFWSHSGPVRPLSPEEQAAGVTPRPVAETWYTPSQWHRPAPGYEQACALDRVRAYLGAMTCTPVAARPLEHTRKQLFDPRLAGWWLVRCGPWDLEHLLPDPAGYPGRHHTERRTRWLTSPRVQLLDELRRDKLYDFEVLDAWTTPATAILKTYGNKLRTVWQDSASIEPPQVRALVRAGVKEAYRQAHGHWRSPASSVQRSDHAGALVAQNAVNTWRRAYTLGHNGGNWKGPWPIRIDTDSLYYPGTPEQVTAAAQAAGWTVWDGGRDDLDQVTELGHWRTGNTLALDPATGLVAPRIRQETPA